MLVRKARTLSVGSAMTRRVVGVSRLTLSSVTAVLAPQPPRLSRAKCFHVKSHYIRIFMLRRHWGFSPPIRLACAPPIRVNFTPTYTRPPSFSRFFDTHHTQMNQLTSNIYFHFVFLSTFPPLHFYFPHSPSFKGDFLRLAGFLLQIIAP